MSFINEIQIVQRACNDAKGAIPETLITWLYDICTSSFAHRNCCICLSENEKIEMHHVGGRKHDSRVVPVCYSCHSWLSTLQSVWDKRALQLNNSEQLRQAFFMLGLCDMILVRGLTIKKDTEVFLGLHRALLPKVGYMLEVAN